MNIKDIFGKEHKEIAFLNNATNVYRTKYYIVKQDISVLTSITNYNVLVSSDTYYLRTHKRDAEYEKVFRYKIHLDGKRLPSTTYTRKYVN